MAPYNLSIISPEGKILEDKAEYLTAPGAEGGFGVLANHAPIVAALKKGVVKVRGTSGEKFFGITSGVLEVSRSKDVLILADTAIEASSEDDAKQKLQQLK